jgi:uncharacterized membrane protein
MDMLDSYKNNFRNKAFFQTSWFVKGISEVMASITLLIQKNSEAIEMKEKSLNCYSTSAYYEFIEKTFKKP